ncbi:VOC family protein [Angustibacter sp. McL0619]|uniref:VOC family protein n=1 Tax=Angustibacter sp. McL0619 TaxID=3415676 RepID=UPI003CF390F8
MDENAAGITHVSVVAVHVEDQQRAVSFYTEVLGFEIRRDAPYGDGARWVEVAPEGGQASLSLVPAHGAAAAGVDTGVRLVADDAQRAHSALVAAGADVDADISRWPGVPPMFSFRDPDGNVLYLVQRE